MPYWEGEMHQVQSHLSIDTFATYGDGSLYVLMLTDNPVSWIMGIFTLIFQFSVGLMFGLTSNDLTTKGISLIFNWCHIFVTSIVYTISLQLFLLQLFLNI